jgi:hypothetical protein
VGSKEARHSDLPHLGQNSAVAMPEFGDVRVTLTDKRIVEVELQCVFVGGGLLRGQALGDVEDYGREALHVEVDFLVVGDFSDRAFVR